MSYSTNVTSSQPAAAAWGDNIDLSGVPQWAQSYTAENILFTRAFAGMNPDTITSDGAIDLSSLGSNPVMVPTDVAAAARSNDADSSSSTSSAGYPAATSAASSSPQPSTSAIGASANGSTSGAGALSSPRVAVALVAVVAAFFAL